MAFLQNHFAFPVAVACDADDEVFRQRPSITITCRYQTGVCDCFTQTRVLQQLRSHTVRRNSLAVLVSLAKEVDRFWSSLQRRYTGLTIRDVDRIEQNRRARRKT